MGLCLAQTHTRVGKLSYHISPYLEKYRGVLVSCQSSEENGVNGTYGHFPLDLFATA
ncbi:MULTISPECIES: DUF1824 family protein [Limnospira]|uniref:DUF1824 family protein n=1 Tax=Limnospira fusiformis PMC 851.14 TaxID=2219512 RepID=A0ABU9EK68_LIMFS|nr:DUF1824 family protein [Limnospira indica]